MLSEEPMQKLERYLEGRVAIITGGFSGIGQSIGKALALRGAAARLCAALGCTRADAQGKWLGGGFPVQPGVMPGATAELPVNSRNSAANPAMNGSPSEQNVSMKNAAANFGVTAERPPKLSRPRSPVRPSSQPTR